MERETDVAALADKMVTSEPSAKMRIAVITAIQASVGRRVKTSATDDAWIPRSEDTTLAVGDRVWLLQQGAVWLVGGRLSGEPGAVPIGALMQFAGSSAPVGWLKCDGAAVSRTTYAELFAVMGTVYGVGNGTTTFNLPDFDDRAPVGSGFTYSLGATGGAATVALSVAEMPAHNHNSSGNHNHSTNGTGNATVQSGTGATVSNNTAGFTGPTPHTHDSVGSGSAHENMPPYVAVLFIVRAL